MHPSPIHFDWSGVTTVVICDSCGQNYGPYLSARAAYDYAGAHLAEVHAGTDYLALPRTAIDAEASEQRAAKREQRAAERNAKRNAKRKADRAAEREQHAAERAELDAAIVEAIKAGRTNGSIRSELGVGIQRANRIRTEYFTAEQLDAIKATADAAQAQRAADLDAEIAAAYEGGMTLREIQDAYRVGQLRIRDAVLTRGGTVRKRGGGAVHHG